MNISGNGVLENGEAGAAQCVPLDLVTPGVAPKTPVSLLQEMAAKQGFTPKYDLLQVEGAVHEPTFLYRATVGEVVASGLGQSKKKAKHMAARAVLDQLLGQRTRAPVMPPLALPAPAAATAAAAAPPAPATATALSPSPSPTPPPPPPPPAPQLVLPYDDGIPGNPVGQLQELCMSRRWPPPTYELVCEEGLPHERTFTIACCIGTYKEIGVGKSKKIAKRQASSLMLTKLRDNSPEDGVSIMDNDDDQIAQKMTAHYSGLRDTWAPKAASQSGLRVSQFHCSLKASSGQLVTELQKMNLDGGSVDSVRLLQEIAQEQNFDVTWVDVEEKTTTDHYHCLVQLSTLPVAVCYGTGQQPTQAKTDAAHNALQYLQIVVAK